MKRAISLVLIAAGIVGAQDVAGPGPSPDSTCIDSKEIRQKFLEGEFQEVEKAWLIHRKTHSIISQECASEQGKYLGVLKLFLHRDTADAEGYFMRVLRYEPMTDLWAFRLPLDLQAFWDKSQDQYLATHGMTRTRELIWATSWLPPVMYPISLDPNVRKLQALYHEQRLKYALAVDNGTYFSILKTLDGQADPAMIPFRSEVKLRAGMSIKEVRGELDKFSPMQASQIVSSYELYFWVDRVYQKTKEQEKALAKKAPPAPEKPVKTRITIKKERLQ